jgi:phage baseplate assembly protein W
MRTRPQVSRTPAQAGLPSPTSSIAAAELTARIDDIVRTFTAVVPAPVDPATLEALRTAVLEFARAHAARTVLETVTARQATRQRRPSGLRP